MRKRKTQKRIAALLCAVILISGLAGCANQGSVSTPTDTSVIPIDGTQSITATAQNSDAPVFMLEKLPEIGGYVDDVICNRRYPEFRDTLTPGEDYGRLIPFVGTFRDYHVVDYETGEWSDETYSIQKYGLMTDKGEIVVDAVYDYVDIADNGDGSYIISLSLKGEEFETIESQLICASDGSWVKHGEEYAKLYIRPAGDDIWVCTDHSDVDYENSTSGPRTYFCDSRGKKLFEFENCYPVSDSEFTDGYLALTFFDDYSNYEYKNRFIDKNGNLAFDGVYPEHNFEDGKVIARNDKDQTGIFTSEGKWFIKPRFEYISEHDNYYFAKTESARWIYDMNGKVVKIISDAELGDNMYVEVYGDRIFYSYSDYSQSRVRYKYYYSETNEPIKCKENGIEVTDYIYDTEYFFCNDGEFTYIVNFDGNTVAKLEGVAGRISKLNNDCFEVVEGDWEDETQVYNIYSRNFKKLWSDKIVNKDNRIQIWADENFVVKEYMTEIEPDYEIYNCSGYDILETETGKPIFENIKDYRTEKINGEIYYYVSDGTYTYTYAPDMTVLMKVRNENND